MKFAAADLRKIQASLLAAVLAGIVSLTAVLLALEQEQSAQKSRSAASEALRERNGKLVQLGQDGGAIRQKLARFGELRQRGAIGEAQRLDWIELLNALRHKHGITLQYELAPQRELESKAAGVFSFHASTMKLQLGLLHEEDLLRILDDLRQQARALVLLRHCKLGRRHEADDEPNGPLGAQLQADCRIDWVMLRERRGQ